VKIAIIRGQNLNRFEMQNYEPLVRKYSITAYVTYNHSFEIKRICLPLKKLHCPEEFTKHLPFPLRYPLRAITYKLGYNVHMFGLEKELRDKDIAHVAETSNGYSYQAIKAKERYGIKVVVTVWENIPFKPSAPLQGFLDNNRLRNEVRENADVFIAVTNRAKEALILEGVQKEKIHVIPVGVDLNRFKPRERDRTLLNNLGLNKNDFVVLFVGRLIRRKGIYDLIYAAKMILGDSALNNIPIKFLLAGDGPERDNIIKETERLQISKNVRLIGNIPYEKIHILHNLADIFVLPSRPTRTWQEQFGMVLVEAMASGNPVISTLSGSIPEVLGDAGILIQPNAPLSLYHKIKKLMLDKKLREDLREKARRRSEKEFDSRKIAEKIDDIYKGLI